MKTLIVIVLLFGGYLDATAQHARIDSINNISFDTKIANAATLDEVFLENANEAKKNNYKLGEANSYSNLGLVYYYQGKYELNVRFVLKAIAIYDKLGATEKQAAEYAGLGYSMKRRNLEKAEYFMQKGKSIAETGKFTKALAGIYDNYGVVKEMQNQLDSALYFYKKGLGLKETAKDSVGIPYSLNNIAGIHMIRKQFVDAKNLMDRAMQIRILRNDTLGIAENYSNLGQLYFEQKLFQNAADNFQKSLVIALNLQYNYLIQNNYKWLADCFEKLNKPTAALESYKKYTEFKDQILNKETNSKIAELDIRFETSKKEQQLAENKIQLLRKAVELRERNLLILGISAVTGFIILIALLTYRQQKLKHRQLAQEHELKTAILAIETQNKLQNQRLDISRDLHDNIGAQLTFIISSVDNIKYAFDIKDTKLETKLSNISNFARDTIVELRDTIWAMNTADIRFDDLRIRILNFIEKAKEARENINFKFDIDAELKSDKLTSISGMNIYRTIQEAVNNTLKYAHATEIGITIKKEAENVIILVLDNGLGYDEVLIEKGNGLRNMKQRIVAIGGSIQMKSEVGKGTFITIALPKNIAKRSQNEINGK